MTNTTQNVSSQHQHNFNAQGVCGCGLTYDQWRAEQDAANAPAEASDGGGTTDPTTDPKTGQE